MKTFHASLTAQYSAETATLSTGWKVTRLDGQTFGWSDHDQPVTIAGVLYRATLGMRATATHGTQDLAVDTVDVTAFLDVSTEAEIEAGIWDEAVCTIFEYNWLVPPVGLDSTVNILLVGVLGPITRHTLLFTASLPGLSALLARRIGRQYTPTCPWRHAVWNGTTFVASVECGVSLAGRIFDATITSVSSTPRREFSASGLSARPNGYFDDGPLVGLTGPNAGLLRLVRHWSGTTFALYEDFPYDVAVGNTFRACQGDNKLGSTCRDIFSNIANFGGFEFVPGISIAYATPTRVA